MLNLLVFTTLFPNARQPNHGVFVENRLQHLLSTGEAKATVLAPVSGFPSRRTGVAAEESRRGVRVLRPVWRPIPGIGMRVAPWLLYRAASHALAKLLAEGQRFDAIDAHYFFPDGVAAAALGRRFGLPVVITARGSDVTQFPDYPAARRMILRAAHEAAAIVTVSAGLRETMLELGVEGGQVTVLRNGVDLAMFRPLDRAAARRTYAVEGRTLVSVGALIPRKGHDLTIAALPHLPGWNLVIAGQGPDHASLLALAARLGVAGRVRLLGAVPHGDLAGLYSAADLSVLSSSREGWANVLLESMACGTAVVASPIAGNPEVVTAPESGMIARERSATAIAACVRQWEACPIDRAATRRYAEAFSWDATSAGQLAIFRRIARASP